MLHLNIFGLSHHFIIFDDAQFWRGSFNPPLLGSFVNYHLCDCIDLLPVRDYQTNYQTNKPSRPPNKPPWLVKENHFQIVWSINGRNAQHWCWIQIVWSIQIVASALNVAHFLDFPDEIALKVMSFTSPRDQQVCCGACRFLKKFVDTKMPAAPLMNQKWKPEMEKAAPPVNQKWKRPSDYKFLEKALMDEEQVVRPNDNLKTLGINYNMSPAFKETFSLALLGKFDNFLNLDTNSSATSLTWTCKSGPIMQEWA